MRFAVFLTILVFLIGCSIENNEGSGRIEGWDEVTGPIVLADSEVVEYEGKRLSSIEDFRENSIKGPQEVDIETYRLTIDGLVENPQSLTYDDVLANNRYNKRVRLDCVEGWSATILWEGVLVKDMIEKANPDPDASTVIFYAVDGYSTSFPISYIMENDIILAYKMNEVIMPKERGYPFELVAESKWGYKWIRWVDRIQLSDNDEYRGYWEQRGYSNKGDLSESSVEKHSIE
jgi:DMSO/TMAO reductase YedYZ molybdopterin-dependent catalytic subunit